MPKLHKFQSEFKDHLFGTPANTIANLLSNTQVDPIKQLQVYQNNVFVSFREALRAIYPALFAMVGEDYFYQIARQYLKAYPSNSGDIQRFGQRLPDFLCTLESASNYPFLPDLAQLEWFCHEIFHEQDAPPFELAALDKVDQDQYGKLIFQLNPAARLMQSDFSLASLWELAIQNKTVDQDNKNNQLSLSPGINKHWILALRPKLEVGVYTLTESEFIFLQAIEAATCFESCIEITTRHDDSFNVQQALLKHIQLGTLVGFRLPEILHSLE